VVLQRHRWTPDQLVGFVMKGSLEHLTFLMQSCNFLDQAGVNCSLFDRCEGAEYSKTVPLAPRGVILGTLYRASQSPSVSRGCRHEVSSYVL